MDRLKEKTCFVTAAAQGIGQSVVEAFLAEGATVIGADLRFRDAPPRPRLSYVTLDATDPGALAEAAAAHPNVGVLVNCVGFVAHGALLDKSIDEFDRSMEINVR